MDSLELERPVRAARRWRIVSSAVLGAASVVATGVVFAQAWPAKPMRLVVPFPPGGTVDITARVVQPGLSEVLGQQVVVENRGGAAGVIGAEHVARSAPDGYTMLMGSNSTISVASALNPKTPYDPTKDFAPVSMVGSTPFVVVVHPSVPAKSVKDLVAIAKKKPGLLLMGSGGAGHLVGELFQALTGTRFTHVPYQGVAPANIALIGGQVDLLFDQLTTALPNIKAGKTRALAVASAKRTSFLPDVPTAAEAGLPNYEITNITGILLPAGAAPAIVERLNAAIHKVLAQPATRERLATIANDPAPTTPAQFAAYIREDLARWQKVVREAGIKPE
jgi:tripartite-type tricarboxylate transporter receptor subunit TctC